MLSGRNSRTFLVIAVLFTAGIAAYSNSFQVPFNFDDFTYITNKPKTLESLKSVWENYSHTRFVTHASLVLNYCLGKQHVVGYHIFNLGIHILNSVLVFVLIRLLFVVAERHPILKVHLKPMLEKQLSGMIAATAALIFLTHPIQTQAVTYIIQRAAAIATFFYLLTMVFYITARIDRLEQKPRAWLWGIAALIAAILAMFSKEIAFTLPIALLLVEIFFFSGTTTKTCQFFYLLPFLACLGIIPMVMFLQSGGIEWSQLESLATEARHISRYHYLLTQFHVICTYFRLLLVPVQQNIDYDYPLATTLWNAPTLLCACMLLFILGWGIWWFYRNRLISFGILFFFLALSVESSIIPIADVIFEHRLYLPIVGFAICMSFALASLTQVIARWLHWRLLFPAVVACYCLTLGILTFNRNEVWQTLTGLWQDAVNKSPRKARPYNNLGVSYDYKKEYDQAIYWYLKAITLAPQYANAYNNLGIIYRQLHRYEESLQAHQKALQCYPNYADAMANLGLIYRLTGRFEESVDWLQRAVRIKPDLLVGHYYLGQVFEQLEQYPQAIASYQKALRYIDIPDGYNNLGNIYYRLGRYTEAISFYRQAIQYNSRLTSAYYNLGVLYSLRNLWPEAVQAWQQVLVLEPEHQQARLRLQEAETMGGRD